MPSEPSTEAHRVRRGRRQFLDHQREMRAGIDDHVDPVPARLVEQAGQDRPVAVGRRILAAQLGLGELDQLGRSMPQHQAIAGEARGQIVDIGLAHRRIGAEHADRARLAERRGGLDRGTVPTIGRSSAARTAASAMVDAVLQAITISRG